MKKATAVAPSNVAFIKYWGRKNETLRLPANGSISMNLSNLTTKTTVEFDSSLKEDVVFINKEEEQGVGKGKIASHLTRVRSLAGISEKARVTSKNSFPKGTGLSSSASGYAALTLAASKAAGMDLSERELSILARQGSGSACRSIPDGFVEWIDGDTSETSYGVTLFDENYWDIVDIVCVLTTDVKDIPTSEGQMLSETSPFFPIRQRSMNDKIRKMKEALYEKNFNFFGELVEAEALEMHAIMMTSTPSLLYLSPETIRMMKQAQKWRKDGLLVYFTLNTGQNVHVLCEKKDKDEVLSSIKSLPYVKETIINNPDKGARLV